MSVLRVLLNTCGTCRHRTAPPEGGTLSCGVDGRPLGEHAEAGECPRFLYPATIDGLDVAEELRRLKDGGCCGAPSVE